MKLKKTAWNPGFIFGLVGCSEQTQNEMRIADEHEQFSKQKTKNDKLDVVQSIELATSSTNSFTNYLVFDWDWEKDTKGKTLL